MPWSWPALHAAAVAKGAASSHIGAAVRQPHGLPWSRWRLEAAAAARAGLACCSGQLLPPPRSACRHWLAVLVLPARRYHLMAPSTDRPSCGLRRTCWLLLVLVSTPLQLRWFLSHRLLVQMGLAVGATVGLGIAVPLIAAELQFWKVGRLAQYCLLYTGPGCVRRRCLAAHLLRVCRSRGHAAVEHCLAGVPPNACILLRWQQRCAIVCKLRAVLAAAG